MSITLPLASNFSDMISRLRDQFKEDGYTVSDTCEKFPYLPIDLFCTKNKEKGHEYWFVLVASINDISDDFQKKLLFYQYYLSLHYEPSEYRIVLAIPKSATVVTTPYYAETKEEKAQDFYKVNGFGLWRITDEGNIDKETYSAITLSDKIAKDYQTLKESLESKKKTIDPVEFVDGYIHFSVKGIAGYYDIKFEERYVDPKLLEKVLKLDNISYKDLLCELVNEHLSKKNKTDFEFCRDTFNKLWLKYLNEEIYPEEHKKLETLLVELYPKYRDHYIHQLQVFLLGLLIIDVLIHNNKIKPQNGSPDLGWLLAASFHDFAYPIQKYDDYVRRVVNMCLGTTADWTFLGLRNDYYEESFASSIEHVLSSLSRCFSGEDFKGETGTNNFNKIRQFFYHEITEKKNHGLIASLGLIKKFAKNPKTEFSSVVLPAAVAIALHDDEICQTLHGIETSTDKEYISLVQKLAPLHELRFEIQPLAFLLILCDNIQDWGRHYKNEKLEKQLSAANIRLKDIRFESETLTIQLFFDETRESLKFMDHKQGILETIEKLLTSSDTEFVIEYWNRKRNEPSIFRFEIGGKKKPQLVTNKT